MSDRTYMGEAQHWHDKLNAVVARIDGINTLPVVYRDLTKTQCDALKNAVLNEVRELKRQLP